MAILNPTRAESPSDDAVDIVALGASARALAESCLRAGRRPLAIDLFGDTDLRQVAPTRRIDDLDDVDTIRRELPDDESIPIVFAGGFDGRPDVVARLESDRPIIGSSAIAMSHASDPLRVTTILSNAGLEFAPVRPAGTPPEDGRWLSKPIGGSGGIGVRHADSEPLSSRYYFQELIQGPSYSAVFLAPDTLVGVSRQLVGEGSAGVPPFGYCGSIGHVELASVAIDQVRCAGEALARALELEGLFGIDFILDDERVYVVDVNPRYTASVEILERSRELSALALVLDSKTEIPDAKETWGKLVLYTHRAGPFSGLPPKFQKLANGFGALVADLPAPETQLSAGDPILTLLTHGRSESDVKSRLQQAHLLVPSLVS